MLHCIYNIHNKPSNTENSCMYIVLFFWNLTLLFPLGKILFGSLLLGGQHRPASQEEFPETQIVGQTVIQESQNLLKKWREGLFFGQILLKTKSSQGLRNSTFSLLPVFWKEFPPKILVWSIWSQNLRSRNLVDFRRLNLEFFWNCRSFSESQTG